MCRVGDLPSAPFWLPSDEKDHQQIKQRQISCPVLQPGHDLCGSWFRRRLAEQLKAGVCLCVNESPGHRCILICTSLQQALSVWAGCVAIFPQDLMKNWETVLLSRADSHSSAVLLQSHLWTVSGVLELLQHRSKGRQILRKSQPSQQLWAKADRENYLLIRTQWLDWA